MNGASASASAEMSRKVLITGVSRGLGRALALEMAKRGHTVIGCSRTQEMLTSLQSDISANSSSSHNNHLFLNVDVYFAGNIMFAAFAWQSSNTSVQELARTVVENKAIPDIIGTINKNNKIWQVPAEEFDAVIDTNVKGVAHILRHFLPLMIENKQGIVVNMSSSWGRSAAAEVAPYCASKWAIEGLSRSVAKELPGGIAIVALSPGVIHTDMLASCFGAMAVHYQKPDYWAPRAADLILNLSAADNGASMSV